MSGVPEPTTKYTIITSELLQLVEIAIELEEHDPSNSEYWIGMKDGLCILLGHLAGKKPVIVRQGNYEMVIDMLIETEVENMFPEDL